MADTVTLPANGAVVGTDEVTIGGTLQQVQRIKLVDGTDGGTDLIGGTAANGLKVDVTRTPRGSKTVSRASMTSTAGVILAAKTARIGAYLYNAGPNDVYLGTTSGVTTSNGFLFPVGATLEDDISNDAWYGICASSQTATIHAIEV